MRRTSVEYPFNDPDGTEEVLTREADNIAAVIVEPVMGAAGMIPATQEFIERLRAVTERLGIVLIFDEVVTFPMAYGGAQAHFGIRPDLTTMSKAIGGGLPRPRSAAAPRSWVCSSQPCHGGKAPITAASTFGGNVTAMAAGIACVEQLTPEVHEQIAARRRPPACGHRRDRRALRHPAACHGAGHLSGMHWAEERVVDHRTADAERRREGHRIVMALMNEGWFTFSFGVPSDQPPRRRKEIDAFHDSAGAGSSRGRLGVTRIVVLHYLNSVQVM